MGGDESKTAFAQRPLDLLAANGIGSIEDDKSFSGFGGGFHGQRHC